MKKLLAVLLLSVCAAFGQTTATVTGHLKSGSSSSIGTTSNAYVRFQLVNCGANVPRVIGSGVIVQPAIDFKPNSSGVISGTIYANSAIDCGGVTNTQWRISHFYNGSQVGPSRDFVVAAGTFNLDSATPTVLVPSAAIDPMAVVLNPTGDQSIVQPPGTKLQVAGDMEVTGNFTGTLGSVSLSNPTITGGTFSGPTISNPTFTGTAVGPLNIDSISASTISVSTFLPQVVGNRYLCDKYSGADAGAKINACLTAAATTGGIADATGFTGAQTAASTITVSTATTLLLGDISLTLSGSPGINLSGTGATLKGVNPRRTILLTSSATADVVQTNGSFFWVEGIGYRVASAVTRTDGAGLRVKSGNGGGRDMRFDATYNGIQITDNGSGGNFSNIQMGSGLKAGGNWNAGILIGGVPTGTVTTSHFSDILINSSEAFTDAMISIRDGADAISFFNIQAVQGGVSAIPLKMSRVVAGGIPEWTKFTNCYFEAGTAETGILITSSRNVQFDNCYITTSRVGMDISGNTGGVIWQGGMITNIQREAIILGGGADILNSWIGDASLESAGTYDTISVSAGVTDFHIIGNTFATLLSGSTNARYNLSIAAGTSNRFWIANNNFAQYATGPISNGATGSQQYIWANYPVTINNRVDAPTSFNALATFNQKITVANGVNSGSGFKHQRFGATTATAATAGATTTNAFSWGAAFADTNYTVSCTGVGPTGTPTLDISSKSASQVTVRTTAITAVASSFSAVDCIAIHD